MAIRVRWGDDPTLLASVATAVGQGQQARRQEELDRADDRFLAGLGEQQRQFDANLGMRALDADRQQQRFYDQQAQEALLRDQYLQSQAADRDARLAASLFQDQQDFAQEQALQDQRAQLAYQAQQPEAISLAAGDQLKQFRQMQLSPEGKVALNKLAGKWQSLQAQRGTSLRPEQFTQAASQWFNELQQADLAQYEVKEPASHEKFRSTLVTQDGRPVTVDPNEPLPPGRYRYINGERNGQPVWDEHVVEPEGLDPQTRYEMNRARTSWGSEIYFGKNGEKEFSPPNQPQEKPEKVEASKYIKQATEDFRVSGNANPSDGDLLKAAERLYRLEQDFLRRIQGSAGAPAQSTPPPPAQADQPELQPGEQIITNALGERAILHTDGTVTPL